MVEVFRRRGCGVGRLLAGPPRHGEKSTQMEAEDVGVLIGIDVG